MSDWEMDISDFVRNCRTSLFFRVFTQNPRWLYIEVSKDLPISNSEIICKNVWYYSFLTCTKDTFLSYHLTRINRHKVPCDRWFHCRLGLLFSLTRLTRGQHVAATGLARTHMGLSINKKFKRTNRSPKLGIQKILTAHYIS